MAASSCGKERVEADHSHGAARGGDLLDDADAVDDDVGPRDLKYPLETLGGLGKYPWNNARRILGREKARVRRGHADRRTGVTALSTHLPQRMAEHPGTTQDEDA